jgi:hypothetical protein
MVGLYYWFSLRKCDHIVSYHLYIVTRYLWVLVPHTVVICLWRLVTDTRYLITMEKRVKTGGNIMRKLYIPFVGSALRASKVAPKQPHPPTTIASPSTTLAPTPRRQRLTTVGGWCDTITQPFLSRFSSRRFCFQAFLAPTQLQCMSSRIYCICIDSTHCSNVAMVLYGSKFMLRYKFLVLLYTSWMWSWCGRARAAR